LTGAAQQDL